jgi:hypothetical protein
LDNIPNLFIGNFNSFEAKLENGSHQILSPWMMLASRDLDAGFHVPLATILPSLLVPTGISPSSKVGPSQHRSRVIALPFQEKLMDMR